MAQPQQQVTPLSLREAFRVLCHDAHAIAQRRGFYKGSVSTGEQIALIMRDLCGALWYVKRSRPLTEIGGAGGKPTGYAVKLADAVIRIADLAAFNGVDLGEAINRKQAWNARRARG